jgi:HK97 family phage portal protein
VGILSWLLGDDSPPVGEIASAVTSPYPSVEAAIAAYVKARETGTPGDLPVVERGVELLSSAVAQLSPVCYRDGSPLGPTDAPRIVTRPDPFVPRYTFLAQTVRSMVETGDAYWYVWDPDPETGRPRSARVIPSDEVDVAWDDLRFLPRYTWRGRVMVAGRDIVHIPLAPRAGSLRGVSPLVAGRRTLLAIEAAELYAAGYFSGSAVPTGVISVPGTLTDDEAQLLLTGWIEAHGGPVPTPAVLSGGAGYTPITGNPEESQLVETREHGVAMVARLLGIPAPLLLVSVGGSSITYANVSALYGELIRATVAPLYLAPIEAAWSDLVPRTSSVRFDLGELGRLDVRGRLDAYASLVDLGVLDAAAVARLEGMPGRTTAFDPTPTPATPSLTPEVPA